MERPSAKDRYRQELDNLADLIAQMPPDDMSEYSSFGFVHTDAAFINRRFLVVNTKGQRQGRPRPPELLGTVRVLDFDCNTQRGSVITLRNDSNRRTLQVGHVPVRLFRFPVFVSVPVYQGVRWEAREMDDGRYVRNLIFGICFKQQSGIRFYNPNNVSVVTPNQYRDHFGRVPDF